MFPPGYKGYSAPVDEPTVFTTHPDRVSLEWVGWMTNRILTADKKFHIHEDDKATILLMANMLKQGLRKELEVIVVELPDEPPAMWTPKGEVSQRWVLDTCYRDGMEPEEACALAYALNKQQVQYDQGMR